MAEVGNVTDRLDSCVKVSGLDACTATFTTDGSTFVTAFVDAKRLGLTRRALASSALSAGGGNGMEAEESRLCCGEDRIGTENC